MSSFKMLRGGCPRIENLLWKSWIWPDFSIILMKYIPIFHPVGVAFSGPNPLQANLSLNMSNIRLK